MPIVKQVLSMIYLPPPQPVLNKDIRVSGDVEIHPTASLAPGVILQAAPDCRIAIGADVCIGMGVIVNASQGSVEIESGAIVGSGVLVIGECKIGNNACIGTAVTIFQTNVEAMVVVEPGAILGDNSRKLDIASAKQKEDREGKTTPSPQSREQTSSSKNTNKQSYYYQPQNKEKTENNVDRQDIKPPTSSTEATVAPETKSNKEPVVGQVYINQLLLTLFPHNKDFNSQSKKLE